MVNLQHGFVPGKNWQSNLLLIPNRLTKSIENGTDADIAYLIRFSESIWFITTLLRHHHQFICKLHNYGIIGNLLNWIRSFFSHRRQQVRLGSTISNWENVIRGVLQGSVFGPVLLTIYIINDLPKDVIALLFLFADNTKLMQKVISTTSHNKPQDNIKRFIEWSKK